MSRGVKDLKHVISSSRSSLLPSPATSQIQFDNTPTTNNKSINNNNINNSTPHPSTTPSTPFSSSSSSTPAAASSSLKHSRDTLTQSSPNTSSINSNHPLTTGHHNHEEKAPTPTKREDIGELRSRVQKLTALSARDQQVIASLHARIIQLTNASQTIIECDHIPMLASLEQQLKAKQATIEDYENQLTEKNSELLHVEQQLATVTLSFEEMDSSSKATIERLESSLASTTAFVDELQRQLNTQQQANSELQARYNDLQARYDTLVTKHDDHLKQRGVHQEKHDELNNKHNTLLEQFEKQLASASQMRKQIQDEKAQNLSHVKKYKQLQLSHEKQNNDLKGKLRDELIGEFQQQMQAQQQQWQQHAAAQQQAHDDTKAKYDELLKLKQNELTLAQQQHDALKTRFDALQSQHESLTNANYELNKQLLELQLTITQQRDNITALNNELAHERLKNDTAHLKATISEITHQNNELSDKLSQLHDDKSALTKQLSSLQTSYDTLKQDHLTIEQSCKQLQELHDSLQQDYNDVQSKYASINNHIQSRDQSMSEWETMKANMMKEVEKCNKQRMIVEEKNTQLTLNYSNISTSYNDLQLLHKQCENTQKSLNAQIQSITQQLNNMKAQYESYIDINEKQTSLFHQEIHDLKDENLKLSKQWYEGEILINAANERTRKMAVLEKQNASFEILIEENFKKLQLLKVKEEEHESLQQEVENSIAKLLQTQNAMNNSFTCTICLNLFNEPKTLLCGHTYCSHCLSQRTKCPDCSTASSTVISNALLHEIQSKFVYSNQVLKGLQDELERVKSATSEVDPQSTPATSSKSIQPISSPKASGHSKRRSMITSKDFQFLAALQTAEKSKPPAALGGIDEEAHTES